MTMKKATKTTTKTEDTNKSEDNLGYVVGIDYSMTCPAICVMPLSKEPSPENCQFYFRTENRRLQKDLGSANNIHGAAHSEYKDDIQRYSQLAMWSLMNISKTPGYAQKKRPKVFVEGYSMGSKGAVFNIGENTGILKHVLFLEGLHVETVPPTVVKKYATGKGTADKSMMYESFASLFDKEKDLLKVMLQEGKKKVDSPLSDIVDAFYIAKYGRDQILKVLKQEEEAIKAANEEETVEEEAD